MTRVGIKVDTQNRTFCDLGANHFISLSNSFFIWTKEKIFAPYLHRSTVQRSDHMRKRCVGSKSHCTSILLCMKSVCFYHYHLEQHGKSLMALDSSPLKLALPLDSPVYADDTPKLRRLGCARNTELLYPLWFTNDRLLSKYKPDQINPLLKNPWQFIIVLEKQGQNTYITPKSQSCLALPTPPQSHVLLLLFYTPTTASAHTVPLLGLPTSAFLLSSPAPSSLQKPLHALGLLRV